MIFKCYGGKRDIRRLDFLYAAGILSCFGLFLSNMVRGDAHVAEFCILAGLLLLVPYIYERLSCPLGSWCWIAYFFFIAASVLGTAFRLYTTVPVWDSLLHLTGGFLCVYAGFLIFREMSRRDGVTTHSYAFFALCAFCFTLTISLLWETAEFAADRLLSADNQKDSIVTDIDSSLLDPTHSQKIIHIRNITDVQIHTADGSDYTIEGGYLDIGLFDTMRDVYMCMIGEALFILFGRRLTGKPPGTTPEKGE
ncbi:MAG: hypothetical protein LKJ76_10295 [Lachnospiraceae bacterium]|jgi:hypothetical protein|nr:hypothetical protein [Lachnospiraceae bacterium]